MSKKLKEKMIWEYGICNEELSKKLKELGVKQESLWYWCLSETEKDSNGYIWDNTSYNKLDKKMNSHLLFYSAFNVAELFNLIGKKYLGIYPNAGKHMVQFMDKDVYGETLADALAKMLNLSLNDCRCNKLKVKQL